MPDDLRQRIHALHEWYCQNVMRVRLTPEVERLWLEWLTAGYNGPQLRSVILYLRKQICVSKRNEGALKLSNLFERAEDGSFRKFDEDLGLATSRGNLNIDKKLPPAPGEGGSQKAEGRGQQTEGRGQKAEVRSQKPATPDTDAAQAAFEDFRNLKEKL